MVCDKKKCTGCFACYNVCPKGAVDMIEDDNGFIYPKIDKDKCINCDLCKKVCPVINKLDYNFPKKCYAVQRKDKTKLNESSSGGVASVLAEYILNNGGIVFASVFEKKFKIHHVRIDNIKDLNKMKGSKYVHSYIEDVYKKAKKDLNNKKEVLFIGTPCQIAGLKMYLMKDYENLFCIDLICHGVPSQAYLKDELSLSTDINDINDLKFRVNNEFKIIAKNNKNILIDKSFENSRYYQGFMDSFFYRENCYECKYSKVERMSDITIGDFWGLSEKSSLFKVRDKGVSVALVCTDKGKMLFSKCKRYFNLEERPIDEAICENTQLRHPANKSKNYNKFKKRYVNEGFYKAYDKSRPIVFIKNKLKKIKLIVFIYNKLKVVCKR